MTRGTATCFLFGLLAASFMACGGRTDMELVEGGAGALTGSGGSGVSGASPLPGAGTPALGGAPNVAGAPSIAGAPSAGGAAHAGSPGIGGAPGFAGSPGGVAGAPAFGGSPGYAGAGGVIVDACVAIAQTACNKCLCQVCSDAFIGCFSDVGCAAIFGCVAQTGCTGFDCYRNAACRGVIKEYGGLMGKAASEVFALASCSLSSQSACACN
ncbi:MAG: hypothetical protein ABJB12_07560 [Pseudomonadota bacterium]